MAALAVQLDCICAGAFWETLDAIPQCLGGTEPLQGCAHRSAPAVWGAMHSGISSCTWSWGEEGLAKWVHMPDWGGPSTWQKQLQDGNPAPKAPGKSAAPFIAPGPERSHARPDKQPERAMPRPMLPPSQRLRLCRLCERAACASP